MERRSVEKIVRALQDRDVRYLIVGGLAVVAHGYVRLTADVDVFLDLERANVTRALEGLGSLGYRPRAPVPLADFADETKRASWVRDKDLKVFSLHSPEHPATEVDLFVEAPCDFATAYGRAKRQEVAPGAVATFAGLDDLLEMKARAGRDQDREDVQRLREIAEGLRDG
jgi:hypothetical protein